MFRIVTWRAGITGDGDIARLDIARHKVSSEPDHERLITVAVGQTKLGTICGTGPEDHDWTSDGESGGAPGVWARGGTTMVSVSRCRRCGLYRKEVAWGAACIPGESDSVAYTMLRGEPFGEPITHNVTTGDNT